MNFPILSSLILLPVLGALFVFITKSSDKSDKKERERISDLERKQKDFIEVIKEDQEK